VQSVGRVVAILASFAVVVAAGPKRRGEPEIQISSLEHRVDNLVNKERTSEKLQGLELDERLSKIARAHSLDMARRRFFGHVNPDGQDPTARGKAAGYTCRKALTANSFREGLGENLFQDNLYSSVHISGNERTYDWNTPEEIARHSVEGWMKSPPHRRNILERLYDRAGVGIAISADDKVYITQVFC
jgi:uncharacterized protein YkwD